MSYLDFDDAAPDTDWMSPSHSYELEVLTSRMGGDSSGDIYPTPLPERSRLLPETTSATNDLVWPESKRLADAKAGEENHRKKVDALRKAWSAGMRDQRDLSAQQRRDDELEALDTLRKVEAQADLDKLGLEYQRNILAGLVVAFLIFVLFYLWWCATLGPEFAYMRNQRIEKLGLKLAHDDI